MRALKIRYLLLGVLIYFASPIDRVTQSDSWLSQWLPATAVAKAGHRFFTHRRRFFYHYYPRFNFFNYYGNFYNNYHCYYYSYSYRCFYRPYYSNFYYPNYYHSRYYPNYFYRSPYYSNYNPFGNDYGNAYYGALAGLGAGGYGTQNDMRETQNGPGATFFKDKCGSCHPGQSRALNKSDIAQATNLMKNGEMPKGGQKLNDDEIKKIVEHMESL